MESSGYQADGFAVFAGHENLEEDPTRYLGWARGGRNVSGLADSRPGFAAQEMTPRRRRFAKVSCCISRRE
jgi:hypothetical protein